MHVFGEGDKKYILVLRRQFARKRTSENCYFAFGQPEICIR